MLSRGAQAWTVLGSLLCGGHIATALNLNLQSTDSIKAAAGNAAFNMMKTYNGNTTGIPGLLPHPPYYWWEAGAMFGQMIHYWYLTGDSSYNAVVSEGIQFQVGENKDFMPRNQSKDLGNDDQVFWAFTALDAAELNFPDPAPNQPTWLALAQAVFNDQVQRWDTEKCNGGLRWQIYSFNAGYDYKNLISNGGFFQLAARLARYTGNQTYADWADKSFDWIKATPVISSKWEVWDGVGRADNCSTPLETFWTYNVGTLLMGSAYMYNFTDGAQKWADRVTNLLKGSDVFFVKSVGTNVQAPSAPPGGDIMAEVACEFPTPQTCNYDQPSFKAYLSRWMAVTTQLAPWTAPVIMPRLQASAIAAAAQCIGQTGDICGRRWYQSVWDGFSGVGEQMSALSVFQANLISKVKAPVTANRGGTSKGDPSAGGSGDSNNLPSDPVLSRQISTADRAGAAILTAVSLVMVISATWWMVV